MIPEIGMWVRCLQCKAKGVIDSRGPFYGASFFIALDGAACCQACFNRAWDDPEAEIVYDDVEPV